MGKAKPKSQSKSSRGDGSQMIRVPTSILRHCSEYTLRILLTGGKAGKSQAKASTSSGGRSNNRNGCFEGSSGSSGRAHWDDSFEGSDAESFLNMLIPETRLKEQASESDMSLGGHIIEEVKLENLPPLPTSTVGDSEIKEEDVEIILPPPSEFDSEPKMPTLELQGIQSERDLNCSEPSGPPELLLGHQWDISTTKKGWFEFDCSLCDKSYDAMWKLRKHEKLKHGTLMKPYQCSACDKCYVNEWTIKNHIRKCHKGRASYTVDDAQMEQDRASPRKNQESISNHELRTAEEDHFQNIVVAYDVMEYLMDCVELLEIYGGGQEGCEVKEDETEKAKECQSGIEES